MPNLALPILFNTGPSGEANLIRFSLDFYLTSRRGILKGFGAEGLDVKVALLFPSNQELRNITSNR